ncbi:MAG: hypothetical protein LAT57_02740 [Balneolales bacterium]|nr:hypothetical protein [Balneolales bacterium]
MSNQELFQAKESKALEIKKGGQVTKPLDLLPVHISADSLNRIDRKIIATKYYNSFNFSKLADTFNDSTRVIGITSANRSDGKTLVASNMAVSLASGYKQKTLLIDMNFKNPQLHRVFGTSQIPGMAEAIANEEVRVVPTSIKNLYLMTAGNSNLTPGIDQTILIRQILLSLKKEFSFVIIDMGAIYPIENFPIHFINEIDGLIGVVNCRKTKKADYKRIFKNLDESQFIAYVFNQVDKS